MTKFNKEQTIKFRVTNEEKIQLKKNASQRNMKLSEYLLFKGLNPYDSEIPRLKKCIKSKVALKRVINNYKQILSQTSNKETLKTFQIKASPLLSKLTKFVNNSNFNDDFIAHKINRVWR